MAPETPLSMFRALLDQRGLSRDVTAETWVEMDRTEDLEGLMAIEARRRGESGQPPSIILSTVQCVARVRNGAERETRWLGLVADAHAVGAATRLTRRHARRLKALTPVIPLPDGRVLGAPVGPLDSAEQVDLLFGRLFTVALGCECEEVILSLDGVDELDHELLESTLAGFPSHELAGRVRIVLTGGAEGPRWRQWLDGRGLAPHVTWRERLNTL